MAHIFPFHGVQPILAANVWLAPTATLIGQVTVGADSSIWFGAVLRADGLAIVIGERTNIQDNAVVHITHENPILNAENKPELDANGIRVGALLGNDITVGHSAVVHACRLGNRVLVGIGSIVLDGAHVGNDVVIAAGSVVPPGMRIPDGVLVMGRPAKIIREISDQDRFWSEQAAQLYIGYANEYRSQGIG